MISRTFASVFPRQSPSSWILSSITAVAASGETGFFMGRTLNAPGLQFQAQRCAASTRREALDIFLGVIEIETPDGPMSAFVARPSGDGPFPAVIMFQEIFGITPDLERIAGRLADAGYLAIVPALFHRTEPNFLSSYDPEGMARGRAAVNALSHDDIRTDRSEEHTSELQ